MIKEHLGSKFQVKELGEASHCLGIEFAKLDEGIKINQRSYIFDIFERSGMSDCKPTINPLEPGLRLPDRAEKDAHDDTNRYRELIGALMYLSVGNRPDITHAVNFLSQFNEVHGDTHWKAAKQVLRYLKDGRALSMSD